MKTKSTLNSFQQKTKVKELTFEQKSKVLGGGHYTAVVWAKTTPDDSNEISGHYTALVWGST